VVVAGAKRRIQDRLDGFPGLTATIVDMLAAHDKIVTRLVWRGRHTGPYGRTEPTGKRVEIADFAVWRFEEGQVAEISTIQDQFALLNRSDTFPTRSVRRSRPGDRRPPGAAWWPAPATEDTVLRSRAPYAVALCGPLRCAARWLWPRTASIRRTSYSHGERIPADAERTLRVRLSETRRCCTCITVKGVM
jgi:hypothetical protein